jgi:hypothetical protein
MSTEAADELHRHARAAKKVVTAWEKHGPPSGTVDDNLRMIADELELLERLAIAHPRRAKSLRRLAERYEDVRDKLVE